MRYNEAGNRTASLGNTLFRTLDGNNSHARYERTAYYYGADERLRLLLRTRSEPCPGASA